MNEKSKAEWHVIGKSIRGASHERTGRPNQDAICWLPESGIGPPLILAISDGHGSAQHFRSDLGAQFAVATAMTELQPFLDGQPELSNLSAVKHLAEEQVPRRLVWVWREAVTAHVAEHPFTEEEWTRLIEEKGPPARQAVEANPALAYGATLLITLVTEAFILHLQLGDGDILTVSERGEVTRPLPVDERLIANETTSLCSPNAWRDFRVGFQVFTQHPHALILLSTDGYANSFADEVGFLKVGSDLLEMIRSQGLDQANVNLERWLTEASQEGSGDDISLGIIRRVEEENARPTSLSIIGAEIDPDGHQDHISHVDEQEERLEGLSRSLQEIQAQSRQISNRVSLLQWGLMAAAFLAVASLALSVVLWLGSPNVKPTEEQRPGVSPSAETTQSPAETTQSPEVSD